MTPEEKDRIEELRKSLYSQSNPPPTEAKRRKLHKESYEVNEDWQKPKDLLIVEETNKSSYNPLFRGLLIFAIIFFVASLAIATVVYLRGSNVISPNNIAISVVTPVSVAAGQILTLDIDIVNKNNSALELADLSFDYPEGTKSSADFSTPLKSVLLSINTINPGQTIHQSVKAVLYGEENSHQNIKVTLTYRLPGSNAVYTKENNYSILIASAPVTLTVDSLKEINSGQDLNLKAHIISNSSSDLENLLLKIDYPFGFTFKNATPTPTFQNNFWNLGKLSIHDSRDITISGRISGEDGDQRVFHFYTGTSNNPNQVKIDTIFINNSQTVAISKPFFASVLTFDGDPSEIHAIRSGQLVHGQIDWQNNLSTPINNASIELKLAGPILDKTSVEAGGGFYRSVDNTLMWDKNNIPDLGTIPPGAKGAVYFTFKTLDPTFLTMRSYRNPIITFSENVHGQRLSDTKAPELITATASSTLKVASNLLLSSSVVHSVGPFANTGPIPPKAEILTTYTINWALTNSYNRADSVKVTATLPSYVNWTGQIAPKTEDLTYNPINRQVTWKISNLDAGTGFLNSPRAVAFQLSLLPSISQVGDSPILVDNQLVEGVDSFTASQLFSKNNALTTRFSTDPSFHSGDEQVVK